MFVSTLSLTKTKKQQSEPLLRVILRTFETVKIASNITFSENLNVLLKIATGPLCCSKANEAVTIRKVKLP